MKTVKRILIYCAIIFAIIFINGCYFVFYGQKKAVEKLKQDKELNTYEIASVYSMHLAICTAGWIFSPEATIQQILMTVPHKDTVVFNNKRVSSEFREHPSGMICYSKYTLDNLRFSCAFNGAYKSSNSVYGKMQYPYLLKPTYILGVPVYEGLIRYLQDKNILHAYNFKYIID